MEAETQVTTLQKQLALAQQAAAPNPNRPPTPSQVPLAPATTHRSEKMADPEKICRNQSKLTDFLTQIFTDNWHCWLVRFIGGFRCFSWR
jgi:hypothetical protein